MARSAIKNLRFSALPSVGLLLLTGCIPLTTSAPPSLAFSYPVQKLCTSVTLHFTNDAVDGILGKSTFVIVSNQRSATAGTGTGKDATLTAQCDGTSRPLLDFSFKTSLYDSSKVSINQELTILEDPSQPSGLVLSVKDLL
jgi:hypothetical protein